MLFQNCWSQYIYITQIGIYLDEEGSVTDLD